MRKYLHLESSKHGEVRRLQRENPQMWDCADNWPVSTFYPTLHPTLGKNKHQRKGNEKNISYVKKYLYILFYNINLEEPSVTQPNQD
jgi:hypothetical protein